MLQFVTCARFVLSGIASIRREAVVLYVFDELCGIAAHDGIGGNVLGDYGSCGHDGILADGDAGQDYGSHAYPGVLTSAVLTFPRG